MCLSFVMGFKRVPGLITLYILITRVGGGESNCDICIFFSFQCDMQKDLGCSGSTSQRRIFAPLLDYRTVEFPFLHLTLLPRRRGRCDKAPSAVPPPCSAARPRKNIRLTILIATLSNAGGLAVIMTRLQADICLADAMLRLDYGY